MVLRSSSKVGSKPAVGCFPLYPPLELLHAMGLSPLVLWGLDERVSYTARADRHLQSYVCRVAKVMCEYILSKGPTEFDALFMYNACDTLRNLPEILSCGLGDDDLPLFKMHLPAGSLERGYSRRYLVDAIITLIEQLEEFTGKNFSLSAFAESVALYRTMRERLSKALERLAQGSCTYAELVGLVMKMNHIDIEDQIAALDTFLAANNSPGNEERNKRVIVSGILPPPLAVCEIMDNAGIRVVADDTAIINRANRYTADSFDSASDYYLDFYTKHSPCTTLLPTADQRISNLLELVEHSAARGFIFAGEKFCEYEYFEFPHLEKKLKEAGVKVLALEFALSDADSGVHQTRIEAFAELLG